MIQTILYGPNKTVLAVYKLSETEDTVKMVTVICLSFNMIMIYLKYKNDKNEILAKIKNINRKLP